MSLTAPSGNAQQAVLRDSLAESGVSERDIAVIECHGTGTALGDAIEYGALTNVIGKSQRAAAVIIGTVKTNLAHTESASGMAGLIKCIRQMTNCWVPPNLHLRQLNDKFASHAGFQFSNEPCLFDSEGISQMSGIVSAFGLGGANATAVVQASELTDTKRTRKDREKDLMKACFQITNWVQEADAPRSVKHACVSQMIFGLEDSFLQV
jgi:acyl transferase domain-containing protein